MPELDYATLPPMPVITAGYSCIGTVASVASAVWPAANRALFMPVVLTRQIVVTVLWVFNGGAVAGNFDIGVYDDSTLLMSTGATAQAGINQPQGVNITALAENVRRIGPGLFHVGLVFDGVVATVFRNSSSVLGLLFGATQMAAAFPLPATAVMVASASGYQPLCGLVVAPRTFV
jgi:hypothetical protein